MYNNMTSATTLPPYYRSHSAPTLQFPGQNMVQMSSPLDQSLFLQQQAEQYKYQQQQQLQHIQQQIQQRQQMDNTFQSSFAMPPNTTTSTLDQSNAMPHPLQMSPMLVSSHYATYQPSVHPLHMSHPLGEPMTAPRFGFDHFASAPSPPSPPSSSSSSSGGSPPSHGYGQDMEEVHALGTTISYSPSISSMDSSSPSCTVQLGGGRSASPAIRSAGRVHSLSTDLSQLDPDEFVGYPFSRNASMGCLEPLSSTTAGITSSASKASRFEMTVPMAPSMSSPSLSSRSTFSHQLQRSYSVGGIATNGAYETKTVHNSNLTKSKPQRRASLNPDVQSRVFTCMFDECGKLFKRSEHLKRHVRSVHTLEKRKPSLQCSLSVLPTPWMWDPIAYLFHFLGIGQISVPVLVPWMPKEVFPK